jgi:hypothetical protein
MERRPQNETHSTQGKSAITEEEDWYEHGFSRVDGSKKRGITSMPLSAAQTLLRWAGYTSQADLAGKMVIDPACGSGNTLLAAAQLLAARGRVRRWGAERVAQEIERCIWGLDPDPIACNVADMRLRRIIAHTIPDLSAARRKALQLHIHQTDTLSLPADARFHLVITNPPLATSKGVVVSYGDFEAKAAARDIWLRFLEQSMRFVIYGGTLAIALPEAFLDKPSAGVYREEISKEWSIERLGHLTGVFRSGPGTIMLLARRNDPEPSMSVQWERTERVSLTRKTSNSGLSTESRGKVRPELRIEGKTPQAVLTEVKRSPWCYALGNNEQQFMKHIAQSAGTIERIPLRDLVTVTRGAEISKEAPEPSTSPLPGYVSLLRGSEVEPFFLRGGQAWLPASAFKTTPDIWRTAKLILPRSSAISQVAIDTQGSVPASALIVLQPLANDPDPQGTLLWLLAMLNSKVLRAYLALADTAYSLARPSIDIDQLRAIPIAKSPVDVRQRLIGIANELTRHYATHGNLPDNEAQYPVGQRLEATLNLEVNTLYNIKPEEEALINQWQLR